MAPLPAHVNAPFFARLARVDLEATVPLNDLLLDQVAELGARLLLTPADDELPVPPESLIDLLSWRRPEHARIVRAFERLGSSVATADVVPLQAPERARGSLATAHLWADHDRSVLTGEELVRHAGARLVLRVSPERAARLDAAARVLAGRELAPRPGVVADWAEAVAGSLGKRGAPPEIWGTFYDELAAVVPDRAVLRGRKILIDDHGAVRRCNGAEDPRRRAEAFFSPRSTGDEPGGAEDIKLPTRLRQNVFFVSQAIDWNPRTGRVASKRPGRALLEDGLVQEYRADALLPVISEVLHRRQAAVAQDVLQWTFRFSTTRDEVPWREISRMRLLVPLRNGSWAPADETLLSVEWSGTDVEVLDQLLQRTAGTSAELDALAGSLVAPPSDPRFGDLPQDGLRDFLTRIGVRTGLAPVPIVGTLRIQGRQLSAPAALVEAGLTRPTSAVLAAAVDQRALGAARPYTDYVATKPLYRLPGQDDYESFPPAARMAYASLIASGLPCWQDEVFTIPMARPSDRREAFRLSSPLRAFLTEVPWVPVSPPGNRTDIEYVRCRDAWSQADDAPPFLVVIARQVRRVVHASPATERRARELGVRLWDAPGTAADRVLLLADLWERGAVGDTVVHNFRSAYEEAWTDFVGSTSRGTPFDGATRAAVVVTRGTRLEVVDLLDPAGETVYVQDGDARQTMQLLEQSEALVVPIRGPRQEQIARRLQEAFPARVRRVSELQVTVSVDGQPFRPGSDRPLLVGADHSWFVDLVAAVVELRGSSFRRTTPEALRRVVARLRRIRLAWARDLCTQVDGRDVEFGRGSRSQAIQDEENPTVLLVDDGTGEATALERAAASVCELIGHPELAADLRLVLMDLRAGGHGPGRPPGPDALAAVLNEPTARVAEVRSWLRQPDDVALSVLIPVVAVFDVDEARSLAREDEDAPAAADLIDWLAARTRATDAVARLTAAAAEGDLDLARRVLQVGLPKLNAAIQLLGAPYEALRDEDAIEQQFRAFRSRCEEEVLHALRLAHLVEFRRGEPLDDYLQARSLSSLTADPAWADEYYGEIPQELLRARVDDWLTVHCGEPDHKGTTLQPLATVRVDNRRQVIEWAAAALQAVRAKAELATPTAEWPSGADLADRMADLGLLDFEPLPVERFLAWLRDVELWPADLPLTLDVEALGLSADAVQRAQDDAAQERRARLEARQRVIVDGREVLGTESNYADLRALVLAGIDDAFRRSSGEVSLRPLSSKTTPRPAAPGRPGLAAARQQRLSDVQAAAVGLAGEVAALEWVKAKHPGVDELEIWLSGYRNKVLGDKRGDDTLGFDIRVDDRRTCWFYEVKASIGSAGEFLLTAGEIARAQNLKHRERYSVLYVEHALNSDLRRIYQLPNPVDPRNSQHFRTVGEGIRYRFELRNGA